MPEGSPNQLTGPAAATTPQVDSAAALADSVFRPGGEGIMGEHFPLLFDRSRRRQLRVVTHGNDVVSLVGVTVDDVAMLGCRMRVAGIGAVCTHPDWRGRGLAGALLRDAIEVAKRQGAATMLISGNRSLYNRHGAQPAGRFLQYTIPADRLPALEPSLTITELSAENCRAALALFEAEPIRWQRAPEDYAARIRCGINCNRPGATHLICHDDRPVAVCSSRVLPGDEKEDRPTELSVTEMAGSRTAMLRALSVLTSQAQAPRACVEAYWCDHHLRHACAALEVEPTVEPLLHGWATVRLLDLERLWRASAPLLIERLGPAGHRRLSVTAETDSFSLQSLRFRFGDASHTFHGSDQALAALFGCPPHDPTASVRGGLGDALRAALPLPLPNYGLNYV